MLLYNSSNANDRVELYLETAGANFTTLPEGPLQKRLTILVSEVLFFIIMMGDESYTVNSTGRKITIVKDGDSYKVNFEFTGSMGLVQGRYTGTVTHN